MALNMTACGICTLHPWEILWSPDETDASFFRSLLEAQIEVLIREQRITTFWIIMDQGLPCIAAEVILALRQRYGLRLCCVIPFEEQHLHWTEVERDRYFSVMQQCDEEYLLASGFTVDCYQRSVAWLLEYCGSLFVVWNGQPSDAGDAIRQAKRKNCHVQSLNLASLVREK